MELRSGLPFWIDGVIFKVNSQAAQKALGYTDNRPKGQIAWKFIAGEAETTLTRIQLSVGHTGKIVPTAVLEPVEIGGVTVTNALLCNWEEIRRLGVGIGDRVTVVRCGDVIPKLTGRVSGNGISIPEPSTCPVCMGPAGKQKNIDGSETVDFYCLNDACPAKAIGKIKRWIKSLDILGLGDEIVEARRRHQDCPGVQRGQGLGRPR